MVVEDFGGRATGVKRGSNNSNRASWAQGKWALKYMTPVLPLNMYGGKGDRGSENRNSRPPDLSPTRTGARPRT